MPTNVNVPYFADPPQNYDRSYLSQITRAFSLFAQQVQNPGEGRNTLWYTQTYNRTITV
jgi:hypothetical protein